MIYILGCGFIFSFTIVLKKFLIIVCTKDIHTIGDEYHYFIYESPNFFKKINADDQIQVLWL